VKMWRYGRLSIRSACSLSTLLLACSAGSSDGERSSVGPVPAGSGGPAFLGDEAAAADGSLTLDQSCAASVVQAETIEIVSEVPVEERVSVPSVYYLMLDSSGSMALDLSDPLEQILDALGVGQQPPTPPKWQFAIDGLRSFIRDPDSAGIELGLRYFPGAGQCDGEGYDTPSVPVAPLPANTAAIEASLAARTPEGGTPLEGALRGATAFCLDVNAARPDVACVAVLITDGSADEECTAQSAEALAEIAAGALEQGVPTFVAGMGGADLAVLDAIGEAGGGDCNREAPGFACDLTTDPSAFVTALEEIRDQTRTVTRIESRVDEIVQVVPCEWEIPPPPAGARFDAARVNVELALSGGRQTLENVSVESSCGARDGWFYDDPSAPARIVACPGTCEVLRGQPEAAVNLLFGCDTIVR